MVLGSKTLGRAKEKLQAHMSQTVSVKLIHGRDAHEVTLPCFSTFGQLKEYAHSVTGIPLQDTRLNFKGRDRMDADTLAGVGVKQGAKIFVGESEEYKAAVAAQREAEELAALQKEQQSLLANSQPSPAPRVPSSTGQAQAPGLQPHSFAHWPEQRSSTAATPESVSAARTQEHGALSEDHGTRLAIQQISQQVDELEQKIAGLSNAPNASKEAVKFGEALEQKLLMLDGLNVTSETRQLRKAQINRINKLCDQLEVLKAKPAPSEGSSWTQF